MIWRKARGKHIENEARKFLRTINEGQEIEPHLQLYRWPISNKPHAAMSQMPPKREEEFAGAINKWADLIESVDKYCKFCEFSEQFKIVVLKQLMVAKGQRVHGILGDPHLGIHHIPADLWRVQ